MENIYPKKTKYPFKEGENKLVMKKGKAAISNGKGAKGLKSLKAKQPKAAHKSVKGPVGGKGSGSVSALAKKSPKKLVKKSKGEVAHAKRAVKLAGYKF